MQKDEKRVVLIGASRGLGAEITKVLLASDSHFKLLGVARKSDRLEELVELFPGQFLSLPLDLTQDFGPLETKLDAFKPHHIFYVAGGGPFGPFQEKSFASHQWAWKVTFEGAAQVCHWALRQESRPQVILVGSSICEEKPDPMAASYAAAKHALRGLYTSLSKENPLWDLRLFSPGYLDTELLPLGAAVRYKKVWSPFKVAKQFVEWAMDEDQLRTHRSLPAHPIEKE